VGQDRCGIRHEIHQAIKGAFMAQVYGTDNAETLNASDGVTEGDDFIFGYGGDDAMFAGGGDDLLKGGGGADTLVGGAGADTASYGDSSYGVLVSLQTGTASGGTAQGDTLSGIENVSGSTRADWLVGDGGSNVLTGLDDKDKLDGGAGGDSLYGDAGDDYLTGGTGADLLDGGAGSDTASYHESSAGVTVLLGNGTASGGSATGDSFASIENVNGSAYADTLWGDGAANTLTGGAGDDSLKGFGGADLLVGYGDNDTLFGGDGVDRLHGSDGDDVLNGGEGADELRGGVGTDTLSYSGSVAGVVINLGNGMADGGAATGDSYVEVENVEGSSHADSLFGDGLVNTLIGAAGNDFLFGGLNDDVFAFNAGFGHDTVLDFAPGGDDIQFSTAVFADFAQVMANATQVGSDVVITKDAGNTVTLDNVLLGSLAASDFIFV
jgi:Ca2+-binding RTX toxin-like protein